MSVPPPSSAAGYQPPTAPAPPAPAAAPPPERGPYVRQGLRDVYIMQQKGIPLTDAEQQLYKQMAERLNGQTRIQRIGRSIKNFFSPERNKFSVGSERKFARFFQAMNPFRYGADRKRLIEVAADAGALKKGVAAVASYGAPVVAGTAAGVGAHYGITKAEQSTGRIGRFVNRIKAKTGQGWAYVKGTTVTAASAGGAYLPKLIRKLFK